MNQKPAWVTIVGVLGIISAFIGIVSAGFDIMMPKMIVIQTEVFSHIDDSIEKSFKDNCLEDESCNKLLAVAKSIKKICEVPDWFGTWSVAIGILKLIAYNFAIFACIFLLQLKPFSIKLFFLSSGINLWLIVLKGIVSMASISLIGIVMMFSCFVGLVGYTTLIIIVLIGDKSAFHTPPPLPCNHILSPKS